MYRAAASLPSQADHEVQGPRSTIRATCNSVPVARCTERAPWPYTGRGQRATGQMKLDPAKFDKQTTRGLRLKQGGQKRGVGGPCAVLLPGTKRRSNPRCVGGVVGNDGCDREAAAQFPRNAEGHGAWAQRRPSRRFRVRGSRTPVLGPCEEGRRVRCVGSAACALDLGSRGNRWRGRAVRHDPRA